MLIGGTIGLWSGFYGGKSDTILMRITDYVLVIPDIPLMIVIAALFGRSLTNIILIIGIIYWTSTARLIRAQTKSVRERAYVTASPRAQGRQPEADREARPPAGDAAPHRQHRAHGGHRHLRGDVHHVPRPRRPGLISWGKLIENAFKGDAVLNDAWWAIIPPGCASRSSSSPAR